MPVFEDEREAAAFVRRVREHQPGAIIGVIVHSTEDAGRMAAACLNALHPEEPMPPPSRWQRWWRRFLTH